MATLLSLFRFFKRSKTTCLKPTAKPSLEQLEDRNTPAVHALTPALVARLRDPANATPFDAVLTRDGVGDFNPTNAAWYLRNSSSAGAPNVAPFVFGGPGWSPVAGDWDGDGLSSVGVVSPDAYWFLKNNNNSGFPDIP